MSHYWKNVLVKPSCTLRDVLEIINNEALRVALVVDDNDCLLGVVTDGDVRRALLAGICLEDNIINVMNKKPTVTEVGTCKRKLVEIMEKQQILAIPVVDNGVVVGLHTLQESLSPNKVENPVFIMAGGFGTRLRPLTNNCPKPLLKVGEKPILEVTLLNFIKSGFINFYISTHYMPEMIRNHFGDGSKWGVSITYVHEENPLGTGGALGLLPADLPDLPLIMMNGDVLTNVDIQKLLAFHLHEAADATMCVREYEYQVPYGVIQGENGQISSMVEKPVQLYHINAGIYVINPNIIEQVGPDTVIDMPTLLESHIDKQGKVMMFPIHEYWLDIGRMEDYKRAQSDVHTLGF
jgi:dTDP-glucose pyrophosphorylase/predicted transcriptional regulator